MRISSADFIRQFGIYTDSALSEPIIITRNGRERLVLLSILEYNMLLHLRELSEGRKQAASRPRRKETGTQNSASGGNRRKAIHPR
jgi:PHD/YefM family antitoxin component YafN of YafNO toxin-antitoxin module